MTIHSEYQQLIQSKLMNQISFDDLFEKSLDKLGQCVLLQYSQAVQLYKKHIIPFEKNRHKVSENLSMVNSNLQHDKIELQLKIDKLMNENHQIQYAMQKQTNKINEMERQIENLTKVNNDNEIVIEQMKKKIDDLQQIIELKLEVIKQIEQDKQGVLNNFERTKDDYNILLSHYMKDKNELAEKLNQMNELEVKLMEKENDLKSQQFYLKKQWEEIEQEKKNKQLPQKQKSIIPDRQLGHKKSIFVQDEPEEKTKKIEKNEILKTPLKKIYKHHQSQIYSVSFNYNGNMLATCGGDRTIKVFDILNMRSGITIQSNSAQSIYTSVSLNYGGQLLLSGLTDKTVQIHHAQTGKQLHSFLGHGERVNSVTWSCSREKCISGSDDRQIKIWEIEKAANIFSINSGKSVKVVNSNAVEPVVYSGHSDGSVRIYSITQGSSAISQIKGIIDYPITSISMLSNRYQVLVSSQQGSTIHLLDLKMNKSLAKYDHNDFFNTHVQADISPAESYVVGGNCDGSIYYWNKDKKTVEKRVSGHDGPVTTLKYHFLSSMLASADNEGNLILWQ